MTTKRIITNIKVTTAISKNGIVIGNDFVLFERMNNFIAFFIISLYFLFRSMGQDRFCKCQNSSMIINPGVRSANTIQ